MRMGSASTFKYILAVFQDWVECATCKDQKMVLYEPCWDHMNPEVIVKSQNMRKKNRKKKKHPPLPSIPHPFLRNKPPISQAVLPSAQITEAGVAQHLQHDSELLLFPPGIFLAPQQHHRWNKMLIVSFSRNTTVRKIKPVVLGTLQLLTPPPCTSFWSLLLPLAALPPPTDRPCAGGAVLLACPHIPPRWAPSSAFPAAMALLCSQANQRDGGHVRNLDLVTHQDPESTDELKSPFDFLVNDEKNYLQAPGPRYGTSKPRYLQRTGKEGPSRDQHAQAAAMVWPGHRAVAAGVCTPRSLCPLSAAPEKFPSEEKHVL